MKTKKVISLFGVIGTLFYFLHVVFGSLFYDGYNPLSQAISDLTAALSPSRNIAFAFSLMHGIFTVIFAIGFYIFNKKYMNKIIILGSMVFCCMNIISVAGYNIFPLSEAGFAETFQDIMHMVVTIIVVLFTILSIILFSIGFFKTDKYKHMGIISICSLVIIFIGVILLNALPQDYFGLAERVSVYTILIYTGILSIWMYKYLKKNQC